MLGSLNDMLVFVPGGVFENVKYEYCILIHSLCFC